MAWTVTIEETAIEDARWFGRKEARLLLEEAAERLRSDPQAETRNMKTLRPNPVAQRELRLFDTYRVLFDVDAEAQEVTIVIVGEKRGNLLFVRGKEYTGHHESNPAN